MSNIDTSNQKFVLICNDEPLLAPLSNGRTEDSWEGIEDLLRILLKDSKFASETDLFAWKKSGHLASAREPYAWRAAIEEIKESDLTARCDSVRENGEKFILITDKPAMLKIAGEITNGLFHSYTSRHKISFVPAQSVSKVPS